MRVIYRLFWPAALAMMPVLLFSQIEVRGRLDGEWLPIVAANAEQAFVLKDGKRKRVGVGEVQVQPAAAFGAGAVTIDKVEADLDPLMDALPKERAQPGKIHFRYGAEVTSPADLPDCYALLVFVANGSVGVNLQPLGRLRAGQPKRVRVESGSRVDAVSALHVFAGTAELRSNQVPESYDAAALWAQLAAGSSGVSAVELCKAEEQSRMDLSRDGKLLATTRDRGDHFGVLVYNLDSMEVVCEVPAAKEYKQVTSLVWTGSDSVAFVVDGELKLLGVRTGSCATLRDKVHRIIMSAGQKPEILTLVVEGARWWNLLTVAYGTKARKTVDWDALENGATMFDPNGEPRVRYTVEGVSKEYFVRIGASGRWVPLDSTVKEEGLKFSIRGDEMLARTAEIEALGQDGDTLYISSRVNSDTFKLAAYSLSRGVITREIASHPKYDLTDSDYNECRLLYHPATSELLGMVYNAERPKVLWFVPKFMEVQKAVEGAFPGQSVIPLTWADDGSTFIYLVRSDRNPGTYYAFRPQQGRLVLLLSRGERLDERRLAQTTPLDFEARDGATIHAYLTLPPRDTDGLIPLLVDIHGGPMVRDCWGFSASNQFFATRGYAVLQVNYRGSSGYGARYQAAGLRARLDTVVPDDIADGVRAVLATQKIDPNRIAVMGGSFGGWATYMSLIKYPEIYRAGVAIAAVAHLRDQQKFNRSFDNRYGYAVWQDILGRKDFAETERFIDPLLRATELRQPVYIMHGNRDEVVSADQAAAMLKALQKTNPHVRSKCFPNAGHSWWPELDRVTQLNEIEGFLREYLAPEPKPASPVAAALPAPEPATN